MFLADVRAQNLNLGLYGNQSDDTFPYDAPVRDVTIEALINNKDNDEYLLHHFNVEGIVTARFGAHVWLEDESREHGIFLFAHYNNFNLDLTPGNKVRLNGAQFYHNGKPYDSSFLTDYGNIDIEVLSENNDHDPSSINIDAIEPTHSNLFMHFDSLTITRFEALSMTFYAKDEQGNEIAIHQFGEDYISNSLWPRRFRITEFERVDEKTLEVGDEISVSGILKETNAYGMAIILLGDDYFEVFD